MRVLLDTNVVSELRKAGRCAPAVAAWQRTLAPGAGHLSTVTLFELCWGIALKARQDPQAAAVLDRWYRRKVRPAFAGRILPVDELVAERCALLHIPRTRPFRDSLIAATAQVHGLTVATRNVRDFEGLDVPLLDPWAFNGAAGGS